MSNLRQAAQQALEAIDCPGKAKTADEQDAITALKAALAEPVQEPVAWRTFDGEGGYDYRTYEDNEDYAAEWAKRNPRHVGWVEPLYAAPPQRKPLTQEKIWHIYKNLWMFHPAEEPRLAGDVLKFARAIERAHGIGGNE